MTPTERAEHFYLTAIRDGLPEKAIAEHVGDDYVQHNQHVATGKDGFVSNFVSFKSRHPRRDAWVGRSFVDGDLVFLHVCQDLHDTGGIWITMDVLRLDGQGRIVEHWDNLAKGAATDLDGPSEVTDLDRTEENKATVRAFVEGWLGGKTPQSAPGLDRIRHWEPSTCHLVLGQGSLVAAVLEGMDGETHASLWVLFHLGDGTIDRVWGLAEALLPAEQVPHDNGKFGFPA